MATFTPFYFYKVGFFAFGDVMRQTGLSRTGTSTALSRWEPQGQLETKYVGICAVTIEPTEENGIILPIGNSHVRVSDLESIVIDCCDRIEWASGIEEIPQFGITERLVQYRFWGIRLLSTPLNVSCA